MIDFTKISKGLNPIVEHLKQSYDNKHSYDFKMFRNCQTTGLQVLSIYHLVIEEQRVVPMLWCDLYLCVRTEHEANLRVHTVTYIQSLWKDAIRCNSALGGPHKANKSDLSQGFMNLFQTYKRRKQRDQREMKEG